MALIKRVGTNGDVTWYGHWRENGRQVKRALGSSKREAEVYLAKIQVDRRERKLGLSLPTREKRPFAEYGARWLETYATQHCKPSTVAAYRVAFGRYLMPTFRDTDIADITRDQVKTLAYKLLEEKSRSYTKTTLAPLVEIFNHAVEDGHIVANPALKILRKSRSDVVDHEERVRPLTREQLSHLLTVCREQQPDWYPFILTLARAGLRIGEATALRWIDVDWHGSFLRIRQNWVDGYMVTPKSGKSRRVDMSDQLSATLKTLHTERKKLTLQKGWQDVPEWVFVSQSGTILNPDNFRRRAFLRLITQAALPDLHIHDLRHTFAALLIMQGESLVYVKEQMGHSSIRVTVDTYGHLIPGSNRQAVNKLDDVVLDADRIPATKKVTS